MSSLWPYSRDLMTTVIEGLEPSVYPFPDESPTSNWGEEVCESVLSFRESSAILSRVVDACVHSLILAVSSVFNTVS